MARLFTSGAEWNDGSGLSGLLSAEQITSATGFNGGASASANPRSGTYHFRASGGGNPFGKVVLSGAHGTTYYFRDYLYLDAYSDYPTTSMSPLVGFGDGTTATRVWVGIDAAGHLQLTTDGGVNFTDTGQVAALNSYFRLELGYRTSASASSTYVEVRYEGVSVFSTTTANITVAPAHAYFGGNYATASGTSTVDSDDVALNDSSGASQTSWPGSGQVVLAKPISDSARTAGWVTGAGGTTNLWDAVNNTPPVGVADTGTATSQIRDATSEASASYDANLTTYTNLGIGASDTINVVVPMVATAAPVTTSSKQGLIGMASNPAITTVALSATGTAGAFWAGAAAAAYPTGWKWSQGTTTYAPSVTKGSSPVARITQVTSSTRIADVCALGMYVDYTPAAVAAVPPRVNVVMAPYIPA